MLKHSPFCWCWYPRADQCLSSETLKDGVVTMTFSGKLF